MTQAVTHVLVPIILLSLFRDIFFKGKKKEKFPLHYVLIGGIAGLIPDIDVAAYYILSFFGFTLNEVHRTFSHNVFIVLIFIILGFAAFMFNIRNNTLGKHHLRIDWIFYSISFGVLIHLLLDATVSGIIMPLYPFSHYALGSNMINLLPVAWRESFIPSLDAVLLVLWLSYMEIKHKISDFI
jgi:membrane-bound metal-dependent hydrolase YbcI (DUF457 family)